MSDIQPGGRKGLSMRQRMQVTVPKAAPVVPAAVPVVPPAPTWPVRVSSSECPGVTHSSIWLCLAFMLANAV
jgi:hypothetical protein